MILVCNVLFIVFIMCLLYLTAVWKKELPYSDIKALPYLLIVRHYHVSICLLSACITSRKVKIN